MTAMCRALICNPCPVVEMNQVSQPADGRKVWDPFSGEMNISREVINKPGARIKVPNAIQTANLILLLVSAVVMTAGFALGYEKIGIIFAGGFCITIALLFLFDALGKEKQVMDYLLFKIAEKHDWAFALMAREFTSHKMKGPDDMLRSLDVHRDPRLEPVYKCVPELVRPRTGQLIPTIIQALYWGKSKAGIPFWMGVGTMVSMGASPKAKMQNPELDVSKGTLLTLITAYDLARDTKIRAAITAESPAWESGKDIQTESVEFNRRFFIQLKDDDAFEKGKLELLRALTPATQDRLLDLWQRYNAQFIFDGATIFMSGYFEAMTEDFDLLEAKCSAAVEDFAEAAQSFKTYVE